MANTSKDKKEYNQKRFQNTEIKLGGEKISIHPAIKLVFAWIVFFLVLTLFIFAVKNKDADTKKDNTVTADDTSSEQAQDTADTGEAAADQITTPMEVDADPNLNEFIAQYLQALAACDADTLKTMVTDASVYDDISVLQARAQYIQGYTDLKCYSKAGPSDDTLVVFVVTNLTLANISTAPMDFTTLYINKTESGYIINNYTQSDDVKAYIETLKQDSDIQAVMRDIETYNTSAIESDADLKAFYEMLGQ